MVRNGIISAGNWIVDSVKFIDRYPSKGNLVSVSRVEEGAGGCAHNVLLDLAGLGTGLPLFAAGCIGNDAHGRMIEEELDSAGIDRSCLKVLDGEATAWTDVYSDREGGRTFFHYRGANARLSAADVLSCDTPAKLFHLGYLLLLDELDKPDGEYGVVAARALKGLKEMGYLTSVDVVSEEGDRFPKIVLPCLKYTDYLIVNEIEAGGCLGMDLRDGSGKIDVDAVARAAGRLLDCGVGRLVVIHYPEGACAISAGGDECRADSFTVPASRVVSSVGAGDAFCAGCLFAIHQGYPLRRMLDFASACARFNLFSSTSTGGAPSLETVEDFLSSR